MEKAFELAKLTSPEHVLEKWQKLPKWAKRVAKGVVVIVVGLNIWVIYRENQKKRQKQKIIFQPAVTSSSAAASSGDVITETARGSNLNFEKSEFRVPELPNLIDETGDSGVNSIVATPSGLIPPVPNPSIAGSISDSDEDMAFIIHSQIQRGLQDLQTGIKLSFEASKRQRLASSYPGPGNSALSPDMSPKSFTPDMCPTPSGDFNGSSTPNTKRMRHMSSTPGKKLRIRRHTVHGNAAKGGKSIGDGEFLCELSNLLQSADRLDKMMRSDEGQPSRLLDQISKYDSIHDLESDLESIASDRTLRNSGSVSSLDSYMTACEEFDYSLFPFLHRGIQNADRGNIECRKLHRYQLFNQRSEREYLGKLYCIRKADRNWISDPATRNWLREMTSAVIRGLLIVDGTDPEPFQEAFDSLLDYSWRHPEKLKEELREQNVPELSLFDVIIDWCLLDAMDDQANPPASITSVLANRWLGNDYKRTGMTTAVWSYIKTKRFRLTTKDSFMTRFYDLCNTLVPPLAWGFLGPSSPYSELCRSFKAEMLTLCQEIFTTRDSWKSQRSLEADLRELISKTFKRLFSSLTDATGETYDFVEPPPLDSRRTYSESSHKTDELET